MYVVSMMLHLQECEGENLETPLALQESLPVILLLTLVESWPLI